MNTQISIDFNGHVAVNIVREDYLKFRENLSFNQICENMGALFIDFFDMYKKGDGIHILDRLNSLRMGIFSWSGFIPFMQSDSIE